MLFLTASNLFDSSFTRLLVLVLVLVLIDDDDDDDNDDDDDDDGDDDESFIKILGLSSLIQQVVQSRVLLLFFLYF